MTSRMPPLEAAVGLVLGVFAAAGAAWLHWSLAPSPSGWRSLLDQPLFWPLATSALWLGGLGWLVGNWRREKDAAFDAYRRLVDEEFNEVAEREWINSNLVQTAFDAVLLTSDGGTVREANAMAGRIFGWPSDELIGQRLDDLLPGYGSFDESSGVEIRTAAGEPLGREWRSRARHADGSSFPVEVRRAELNDPDVGVLVVREASTRLKEEARAVRAAVDAQRDRAVVEQRRRGTALLDFGSTIRAELERIIGRGEALRDEATVDAALAGLRALERLWNLSMWERATSSPTWGPASMQAIVQDAIDAMGPIARRQGTSFTVHAAEGTDDIVTDVARLSCIVRNILGFACRHARGSDIRVQTLREPGRGTDWVALFAEFTGEALPDDERARVLDAFSASESGPAIVGDQPSGLALAQRLARGMGGHVIVTSSEEGAIALSVRVPLDAAAASKVQPPASPPTPASQESSI